MRILSGVFKCVLLNGDYKWGFQVRFKMGIVYGDYVWCF